jgi:hypothetical protein
VRRAGLVFVAVSALALPSNAGAQDLVFNQYSVYRVSPAARYFTPGSLIMGWRYKGVLRLTMVCRNKVDIEADEDLLRSKLEQAGAFTQSGWQFDVSANVAVALNSEFKANLVNAVTMTVSDVTVYEYSAEELRAIRRKLLARESCAQEARNPKYRIQENYNGGRAGLFQNQRFAIGNITYTVQFNKDNPQAAKASVQAQVTKKLQVKFGLTYLDASQTQLKGEGVVLGVYPSWRDGWN